LSNFLFNDFKILLLINMLLNKHLYNRALKKKKKEKKKKGKDIIKKNVKTIL